MAGSQTLRFDVVGDASSAARAFRQTADGAALAARGAKQLSESLGIQSKTAQVSAAATVALAKSDDVLRDAELQLAASADEAGKQLGQQGRAAEDAAAKTRVAGDAAKGAGSGFGVLATPMGALVGAGVALSPVLVTVGFGLAGLAAAAAKTVAPVLQAGTATKQAQQALAGLDPAQRAAYNSLGALKGEFSGFSKSLEPEVLGLFNRGLDTASGLMHDVQPVAAATGKALGTVLGQVDAEFRSQNWQNFFGFMAKTAGPDVQLLGNLIVTLTDDLPGLLEGLQPAAQGFLVLSDDALKAVGGLERFAGFVASHFDNSLLGKVTQGFNAGFDWLEKHIPAGNKSILDLVTSSQKAADSLSKTGDGAKLAGTNAAQAGPQVGTLAGDVALLNTSATDASTALSAYSDAWNKILGNSLSDQQAVLADESAFSALTTAVKKNGGQSLQARQAFVSYMQQVGTSISTLQQNGASVGAVNAEYETNIRRLQGLHNLTPAQRSDIAGLIRDYDTWANSTAGLNKQTVTAAQTIRDNFTSGLKMAGDYTPKLNTDVTNLSNSILKTGTTSSATKGDRAALIADLEKAGIDADTATKMVDGLERKISGLKGKTVGVNVVGSGSGKITFAEQNIKNAQTGFLEFHAAGGRVGGTGTGTSDSNVIAASRGEWVIREKSASKYGHGAMDAVNKGTAVIGYASGGLVGVDSILGAPDWMAAAGASAARSAEGAAAQAMIADMAAKVAAAAASVPTVATAGSAGGIIATMMRNMAAARGWTGAQWNALYAVEAREAGFNMTARNPSSGAYGLAQFINGPSEYAQYGGNATTATGQITAMLNYIAQRYGTPAAAWAHEVNYGWYDRGGTLKPGFTLAYNGTGRPEQVIPGGRGGGDVHVHLHNDGVIGSQQELKRWLLESTRELARTKGGGNVQTAFGRP